MEKQLVSPKQSNSLILLERKSDQDHVDALSSGKNGEFLAALQVDPVTLITNAESIATDLGKITCVERNDPTPAKFVTERIRIMLQRIMESKSKHGPKEVKRMQVSLINATVQSYDRIANAKHANDEEALRDIETQVMLRLQYWASLGITFARMYTKVNSTCNKKMKKSNQNAKLISTKHPTKFEVARFLYNDIIDLLTMSAMKLPQTNPFPSFLRGCLDKSFLQRDPRSLLPKNIFQQIFVTFEVKDPDKIPEEQVILFTQHFLPKRKRKRNPEKGDAREGKKGDEPINSPSVSSLNQAQTRDEKSHDLLTSQSLGILAPGTRKKNSLFAAGDASGHRSSYVGSHFNTKLVNTSSLFREVKMPNRKIIRKAKARVASKHPQSSTSAKEPKYQSNKRSRFHETVSTSKPGPQSSKRKLLHCFQATNTTKTTKKVESLLGNRAQEEAPLRKERRRGLGVDVNAARRVVAAARTALKRQP